MTGWPVLLYVFQLLPHMPCETQYVVLLSFLLFLPSSICTIQYIHYVLVKSTVNLIKFLQCLNPHTLPLINIPFYIHQHMYLYNGVTDTYLSVTTRSCILAFWLMFPVCLNPMCSPVSILDN